MYHDTLLPLRPPGAYHAREYWYAAASALGSHIRDPLLDVIAARVRPLPPSPPHALTHGQEVKQAHGAVEPLLTALWHAEFQQRFGLCRTALALLADVGLEYGMTRWCRRVVEELLPQVRAATLCGGAK